MVERTYTAQEYREAIRYLEGIALGAVGFLANHPERCLEAMKRISKAANRLLSKVPP